MKSEPTIVYRDINIRYFEGLGFRPDGMSKEYPDLLPACEAIDRSLACDFKPTPIFMLGYQDELKTGIATSVNEEGDVWISHPEKKGKWGGREKRTGPVFLDTPENRAIVEKIAGVKKELEEARIPFIERINELMRSMKTIGGKQKDA